MTVHGPGSGFSSDREAKLSRAVQEIRDLIRPWGEGDHARLIRGVLDRNGV